METIRQLIGRYLDNELSETEAEQLASALRTDVSALDEFVLDNVIHSQLLDLMDEKRLQDRVIGESISDDGRRDSFHRPPAISLDALPIAASAAARRRSRSRDRLPFQRWGAVAALLLVAASISSVGYMVLSRPSYVGTLTEASSNARWGAGPEGIAVGTFLQEGQELELITGNAVITFSSGAKLFVEGPTTLHVDSPKDVRLVSGRVAAKVPRPAIGFTVHSTLADFVDLGTAFTLNLDPEKTFQLHVFEGLVEVRLNERFGNPAKYAARIAEVLAVSFDVKKGDIAPLHFEEGLEMPF